MSGLVEVVRWVMLAMLMVTSARSIEAQTIDLDPVRPSAFRAFGPLYRSVGHHPASSGDESIGATFEGPTIGAFLRVPEWLGGLELSALYGSGESDRSMLSLEVGAWADRVVAGDGPTRLIALADIGIVCRKLGGFADGVVGGSGTCDGVVGGGGGFESRVGSTGSVSIRGAGGMDLPFVFAQQDRWFPRVGWVVKGDAVLRFEGILGGGLGMAVGGGARYTRAPRFLESPETPEASRWIDFDISAISAFLAVVW